MRRRVEFLAAIAAAALIGSCGPAQQPRSGSKPAGDSAATTVAASDTAAERMVSVYEGVLPCADCGGIRTKLTLYAKPGWAEGNYKLSETYLATRAGDHAVEASGQWTTLKGDATDDEASVYQLNPDDSLKARNFLRVSHEEIRLLDKESREIHSKSNLSLRRTAGGGE